MRPLPRYSTPSARHSHAISFLSPELRAAVLAIGPQNGVPRVQLRCRDAFLFVSTTGPLFHPAAAPAPLTTMEFTRKWVVPLVWANEEHVSPFCATTTLLQLLARPPWVGIAEVVVVDDVGVGVLVVVADVVDTPT